MKKQTLIIIIVLILASLVALIFIKPDTSSVNDNDLSDMTSGISERMCYLYEKEARIVEGEQLYDREYIEIVPSDDQVITGNHFIVPSEKDSNRADLIGVTDGTYVNVIATASGEGMTWQEQRIYKIIGDAIYVGYQPVYVPKYQDESGVYMFEDPSKLIFETEEYFLNEVDCGSVEKENL